jgi:predicted  nucleic acid-binding Zn-ribbon protein
MSTTPRTDAATYPADCLGKTQVVHRDLAAALETELREAEQVDNAANHYRARAEKAEAELAQAKERVHNEMMFSESVQGQNLDLVRKVSELEGELEAARLRLAESEGDAEQMEDLNFKISELEDLLAEAEERE